MKDEGPALTKSGGFRVVRSSCVSDRTVLDLPIFGNLRRLAVDDQPVLEGLEVLTKYLGGHRGLDKHWLHKEEVCALIMLTGRCAGFTVKTEVPIEVSEGRRGYIDCGWFYPDDELAAAFEFDGP
jgi:hypothetical protein